MRGNYRGSYQQGGSVPLRRYVPRQQRVAVDPLYDLDPNEVARWERTSGALGSNPGGMYQAPDGSEHYIKAYPGLVGHDRTLNEQLANKLYQAANVPVPDTQITRWKDGTAISSPVVKGMKLSKIDPAEYPKIKDLLEHFAADAWLANYDVAGTHHNNIYVDDANRAWRIDNGGALRYRATGKPKEHWDEDAQKELDGMRDKEYNEWSAKLFRDVKTTKDDPSYQSALRVSQVPDDVIEALVNRYGPGIDKDKEEIANIIKARRDAVAKAYGIKGKEFQQGGAVDDEDLNGLDAIDNMDDLQAYMHNFYMRNAPSGYEGGEDRPPDEGDAADDEQNGDEPVEPSAEVAEEETPEDEALAFKAENQRGGRIAKRQDGGAIGIIPRN